VRLFPIYPQASNVGETQFGPGNCNAHKIFVYRREEPRVFGSPGDDD
jgi:hypothetical protein